MTGRCAHLTRAAALAALAALAACSSDSQARLAAEAHRLVQPGAATSDARAGLHEAGFACGPITGADRVVTCARTRAHAVVATCVQRVTLQLDPSGGRVVGVGTPRPACTGF